MLTPLSAPKGPKFFTRFSTLMTGFIWYSCFFWGLSACPFIVSLDRENPWEHPPHRDQRDKDGAKQNLISVDIGAEEDETSLESHQCTYADNRTPRTADTTTK